MVTHKAKGIRKFRLTDYEMQGRAVIIGTGKLEEMIEGEPLKSASWDEIGNSDTVAVEMVIFQKQGDGFKSIQTCGGRVSMELSGMHTRRERR